METTLSVLFKETRKKLGISQEEMALRLGCTRVSVSNYERNEMIPGGDKVEKLMELAKEIEALTA